MGPSETHFSPRLAARAKMSLSRAQNIFIPKNINSIVILFPIACFLYTLLPSPRDTLELLGQILIKRNITYWLNTSLFDFDTRKGLTVKIYIILVCTPQQWALHILDVVGTPS